MKLLDSIAGALRARRRTPRRRTRRRTLEELYQSSESLPFSSASSCGSLRWRDHFLSSHIRETWSTKSRIANYVRKSEDISHKYRITLIHAEVDTDIPWHHTPTLFSRAVNATSVDGIENSQVSSWKLEEGQDIGVAGHAAHWRTEQGVISEYLLKYGLHDVIMGSPIVTLAAMDIYEAGHGLASTYTTR